MIFHKHFPNVLILSNFYVKQFGEKALTYHNKMTEVLQTIYDKEKPKIEEKKDENVDTNLISWQDFEKVDIRVGTIVSVNDFPKARNPAYILEINFGALGIKKKSAQITSLSTKEELIDKQIIAVVNFPKNKS